MPDRLWQLCSSNRSLVTVLVVCVIYAGSCVYGWSRVSEQVLQSPDYHISVEDVHVTETPSWIGTDIRTVALANAGLPDQLDLFDADLNEQLANEYAKQTRVARVQCVRKRLGRIDVDLEYREPIMMVRIGTAKLQQPVDRYGTVLPLLPCDLQLSEAEILEFPRLEGLGSRPKGGPGLRWGDVHVAEGAKIVSAIGRDNWTRLQLHIIEAQPSSDGKGPAQYVLKTRGGNEIPWGTVSGGDRPDDPETQAKADRVISYFKKFGTLDDPYVTEALNLPQFTLAGNPLP